MDSETKGFFAHPVYGGEDPYRDAIQQGRDYVRDGTLPKGYSVESLVDRLTTRLQVMTRHAESLMERDNDSDN